MAIVDYRSKQKTFGDVIVNLRTSHPITMMAIERLLSERGLRFANEHDAQNGLVCPNALCSIKQHGDKRDFPGGGMALLGQTLDLAIAMWATDSKSPDYRELQADFLIVTADCVAQLWESQGRKVSKSQFIESLKTLPCESYEDFKDYAATQKTTRETNTDGQWRVINALMWQPPERQIKNGQDLDPEVIEVEGPPQPTRPDVKALLMNGFTNQL